MILLYDVIITAAVSRLGKNWSPYRSPFSDINECQVFDFSPVIFHLLMVLLKRYQPGNV